MPFKPIVAAAALVLGALAGTSHAANFLVGELPTAPAVYSNTVTLAPGAFLDTYTFLFPAAGASASSSAVAVNLQSFLNISNLQVSLFDAGNNLLAQGGVGVSSVLFDVPLVGGNAYWYMVTGTATGSLGGAYSFITSAAPVPEPETYAMMLAGLGVVGFLALRRRNTH